MASIDQDILQIRAAVYGKDVREAIAESIEQLDGKGLKNVIDGPDKGVIEGQVTANTAAGQYAHAEGLGTAASGNGAHAEGYYTQATGKASHAEGGAPSSLRSTKATGNFSHAEGNITTASGDYSHSEGCRTTSAGQGSHAEGEWTTASNKSQHVFGECNAYDGSSAAATERGNYVEIVGNGTTSNRSNARTLDWSGNERLAGDLYVQCESDSTGGLKVATEEAVGELRSALEQAIDDFAVPTQEAVNNWLTAHPEATTTVQDGSLTEVKFSDALKLKTVNDYVMPEMYGAKGDGITDDSDAFINAIATGKPIRLSQKRYFIGKPLTFTKTVNFLGSGMHSTETGRSTVLEFPDLNGEWCITIDGAKYGEFGNLTIKSHASESNTIKAIHFANDRSWYTNFHDIYIDDVSRGILIDAPSGYNNFQNIQLILKDNDAIGVEIGSSNYSTSAIQPNYIYFNYVYFGNSVNFGANNYTDVMIHNGQHILFSHCDFVAANRAIHFADSAVSSSGIKVSECWFFAPFTVFYATNNKSFTSIDICGNTYVVKQNQMKMLTCDGNSGYLNYFNQQNETIINSGGSLASEMYTIANVFKFVAEHFVNGFSGFFYTSNTIPRTFVRTLPDRGSVSESKTVELYADGLGYVVVPYIFDGAGVQHTITIDTQKVTISFTGTGMYSIS